MLSAFHLLDSLSEEDLQWLALNGTERTCIGGTVLIEEGVPAPALFLVLEGLFEVRLDSTDGQRLATLGPGEIAGDISLLEQAAATATVAALETSLVLELSQPLLRAKLEADPGFSAGFHRGLALLNARRLRQTLAQLGSQRKPAAGRHEMTVAPDKLSAAQGHFKQLMSRADAAAIKNGGKPPPEIVTECQDAFVRFYKMIDDEIGDASSLSPDQRVEAGLRIQRELLPYLLMTETAERFYSKPRGYAGDYLTIEFIYKNTPTGSGRLGPLVDSMFLNTPSAVAVRNRRGLMGGEISRVLENATGTARVMSLACGPAREVFDVFEQIGDPERMQATLVDIDDEALELVARRRDEAGLESQITLVSGNLIYLAMGRQKLDVPPQDFIYSIGLIDYFNDRFVIKLLNWIHSRLKPGGKVMLGNFHPRNRTKGLMDHVMDWKLIHRTEEDMDRLYQASAFARPCTRIRFEEQGINLFAECIKSL